MRLQGKIKKALCAVLFVALLMLVLQRAAFLVERKDSMEKYQPFYDQKEPFDVLIIGTSHAINGIFPMDLWDDYGIVSYNFGGHDNQPATSYWVLQNALQYTKPKLVVLDVFGAASQGKVSDDLSYLHLSTDSMPFSKVKVDMLNDILPEYGNICDFLFDFSLYHNRWNELTQDDFFPEITKEKGAESRIRVASPEIYPLIEKDERFEEDSLGKEYIEKMIVCCQENGIELLLVNLPFPASGQKQRNANSIYPIAEKYGVEYINYLYQEDIVNYRTDFYDEDAHLNPSGARKVTKDLGRILSEEYHVPDRRQDAEYAGWFEDYEEYVEFKISNLKKQSGVKEYLMLLNDEDFKCFLSVDEDPGREDTGLMELLIQNIPAAEVSVEAEQETKLRVIVTEIETGEVVDTAAFDADGIRVEEEDHG